MRLLLQFVLCTCHALWCPSLVFLLSSTPPPRCWLGTLLGFLLRSSLYPCSVIQPGSPNPVCWDGTRWASGPQTATARRSPPRLSITPCTAPVRAWVGGLWRRFKLPDEPSPTPSLPLLPVSRCTCHWPCCLWPPVCHHCSQASAGGGGRHWNPATVQVPCRHA